MRSTVNEQKNIEPVVHILKKVKSILFVTGAGISAESGLPTYRGAGGLYDGRITEDGIPIEMALAGQTLETNPSITWKYLLRIEEKCRNAAFNLAHKIIADMEKHFERVWVLTQNIDGFHLDAGSKNVIEIHGNMHKLLCTSCGWRNNIEDFSAIDIPPLCPRCESIVRPDVVFFGEMLPYLKLQKLFEELQKGFDLYFSIGTTSVFPYIAKPIIDAKRIGRPTVEINPSKTEVSDIVDIKISLGAVEALQEIWKEYKKQENLP